MFHRIVRVAFGALACCVLFGTCGGSSQVTPAPPVPSFPSTDPATSSTETTTTAPSVKNHWEGVPPLAPLGQVIHQASYDIAKDGSSIGEERLAVGIVDGAPVIVGQSVTDWGGHFVISYMVGPAASTVTVNGPKGQQQLSGKVSDGILQVTGNAASGEAVTISTRLPMNGFLSAPGIGSTLLLVHRLGDMKVGETRHLDSLLIGATTTARVTSARHNVERKADHEGQRVFSVRTESGRYKQVAEVIVDRDGLLVKETVRGPANLTHTRLR
jgi:hypothetical protein